MGNYLKMMNFVREYESNLQKNPWKVNQKYSILSELFSRRPQETG